MSIKPTRPTGRFTRNRFRLVTVPAVLATALAGIGLAGVSPAQAATTDLTGVVINEIESNGDTTDWIELYNPTGVEIDLSEGILSDSGDDHAFPLTGTIAAHGYAVFDVDQGLDGFGLGGSDAARLFQGADPITGTVIDDHTWTSHAPTTYGRNGSGAFAVTAAATRGAFNSFPGGPTGDITGVVINEVESDADTTNGDWIELYNTTGSPIDISGAILSDSDDGHIFTVPASTVLAGGDWIAFTVDGTGGFGLGAADEARLFQPGDVGLTDLVDDYAWTAHAVNTYGRNPDGTGAFASTSEGTFGADNEFTPGSADPLTGVVISEAKSAGDDTNGDWIELRNTSGSSVDLTDAILSDDNNAHAVRLPAHTLAAGGYFAFRVDNPAVSGNFGLGDTDAARLFTADTINLATATAVDEQNWAVHAPTSWGLNGSGTWAQTTSPSFGAVNVFSGTPSYDISWVVISEIESSGGTPGDWIELKNTAPVPIVLTGAKLSDNNNGNVYTLPTVTIPANGFYTVDIDLVSGGFGLGSDDAVRLYRAGKTVGTDIPLDHHEWTQHANGSYIRTASGLGEWAETTTITKNAANPS